MPFKYRCLLIISPIVLLLDQWTKHLVRAHIPFGGMVPVIPGYCDLVHVMNTGAAFSMLAGPHAAWRTPFFLTLSVVALGGIGYFVRTLPAQARLLPVVFALVVGGIFGNLIDRLRFGAVTDFLSFHWGNAVLFNTPLEWPSFNVADSAITVSMVLLAYQMFRKR